MRIHEYAFHCTNSSVRYFTISWLAYCAFIRTFARAIAITDCFSTHDYRFYSVTLYRDYIVLYYEGYYTYDRIITILLHKHCRGWENYAKPRSPLRERPLKCNTPGAYNNESIIHFREYLRIRRRYLYFPQEKGVLNGWCVPRGMCNE